MHSFFGSVSSPDRVPLNFIDLFDDCLRELIILHYVGRDIIKAIFCKGSAPNNI